MPEVMSGTRSPREVDPTRPFSRSAAGQAPGRQRSDPRPRGRLGQWQLVALGLLLAATAGCFGYAVFPGPAAAPRASQLNLGVLPPSAEGGLLGQGQGQGQDGAYDPLPEPVSTGTARNPGHRDGDRPGPVHSRRPVPPPGGVSLADAAGLGFYDGTSSPAGLETAASWLGSAHDVKYAEDFIDATDFAHISNPWQLPNWQGSPFTMIWGVPMVPCGAPATQCATNVSAFDQVANGGADGYYQALAQHLVSAGFGNSYIRLGWEFNGTWMGWSVCSQSGAGLTSWAGDFVAAFRNIVNSMRSVGGADFKFIWNPIDSSNASCPGASLEDFYPGDGYVDMVSLDVYDGIGQQTSDAARWNAMLNGVNAGGFTAVAPAAVNGQQFQGYGLNWLTAFGKAHGKQVGMPEWGLDSSGLDAGGGDDPFFITQVAAWIKANATGPAIFWNSGGGTLALNVPNYTAGGTPDASAAFRAAFTAGV
jgi:Glycosyl hydrolase family 26